MKLLLIILLAIGGCTAGLTPEQLAARKKAEGKAVVKLQRVGLDIFGVVVQAATNSLLQSLQNQNEQNQRRR
jgi:hypothetical protein